MTRSLYRRVNGEWVAAAEKPASGVPGVMRNVVGSVPSGTSGTVRLADDLPVDPSTTTGIRRTRDDPTGTLGGPFSAIDPPTSRSRDFIYLVDGTYTLTSEAVNQSVDPMLVGPATSVTVQLGAGGGATGVVVSDATGVQAGPADRVSRMTGVNLHLNYPSYKADTPGATTAEKLSGVVAKVLDIGFRHVRDDQTAQNLPYLRTLGESGCKWWPFYHNNNTADVTTQVNGYKSNLASMLEHVDGHLGYNEPDNGSFHTASTIRTQQQTLHNALRADSRFDNMPITTWASTFPRTAENTGVGDINAWAEGADWHPYPAGSRPETNDGHNFPLEKAEMDARLGGASRHQFPASAWDFRDAWKSGGHFHTLSEMGWHNNVTDTTEGHRGAPRDVAALYAPPSLLWYDSRGMARVMFYEFLNQAAKGSETSGSIQGAFGIVEQNLADKPIAVALRNFLELYTDKGSAFVPGKLNYAVTGGNTKTYHMLHQKRNGVFLLGVYQAEKVWNDGIINQPYGPRLTPASLNLTVTFASRAVSIRNHVFADTGAVTVSASATRAAGVGYAVSSGPGLTVLEVTP